MRQLSWRNWERLCLRMARLEADVQSCSFYGRAGQAQAGIDLYGRTHSPARYTVYQCKQIKRLTRTTLKAAVTKFTDGVWSDKASTLVIFTSFVADDPQLLLDIESQRDALAARAQSVQLEVWDAEEIAHRLKTKPAIVHDFFGREWARAFCGNGHYDAQRRMDAHEVARYRKALRGFYEHAFNRQDPGIPIRPTPGVDPVPFPQRYEPLDVLVTRRTRSAAKVEADTFHSDRAVSSPFDTLDRASSTAPADVDYTDRRSVEDWLVGADRSVIVGGPGAGKSALLFHLALDLLSEAPTMADLAAVWGTHLPVWLPFRFWTKLIAENAGQGCSLSICLQKWFLRYDKSDLVPLVEAALRDERLLLLVDGLDEWVTESAGHDASNLLHVFAQEFKVAIVVTSRPYGVERLPSFFGSAWQQASLAPLSDAQRDRLVFKWCHIKLQADFGTFKTPSDVVEGKVDGAHFLQQLEQSRELTTLAAEPLMLLLLLYMWFAGATLPRRRFDAYDQLVRHFLDRAAQRRAAAGTPGDDPLAGGPVRDALAHLAFTMQRDHETLIIPIDSARRSIESFLRDEDIGLGMTVAEAKRHAREFSEVSESDIGVLVRQGVAELGFIHRSFQEFLAAEHLARLSAHEQLETVSYHALDPRWHEVLLALCWLTRGSDHLRELIRILEQHASESGNGLAVRELLAEIAFGDFRCPADMAREIATDAIIRVERHGWMPHRRRLILKVVDGLRSTMLRDRAKERLARWVWAPQGWRPAMCYAVRRWNYSVELVQTLITTLHDEDGRVQLAGATALAAVGEGRSDVADAVAALARAGPSATTRAAALQCLTAGWPEYETVAELIEISRASSSAELRLAAIAARIGRGERSADDFAELCAAMTHDIYSTIDYAWRDKVAHSLVAGWSGDALLLTLCLGAIGDRIADARFEHSPVLEVMLDGFPGHPAVGRFCAQEVRDATFPFIGSSRLDTLRIVATHFRDHPGLRAAAEGRALRRDSIDIVEATLLSYISGTETAKRRLLAKLSGQFAHWPASMLLEGWRSDDEVRSALVILARSTRAEEIAHLIPDILDPTEAHQRLIELIRNGAYARPDFVFEGLRILYERGVPHDAEAIVPAALAIVDRSPALLGINQSALEGLISIFGSDYRVHARAVAALADSDAPIGAIASVYGADAVVRARVIEMMQPLSKPLRLAALEALQRNRADDFAATLLERYYIEHDDEVRVFGAVVYHQQLPSNSDASKRAIERLRKDLKATGPFFQTRRRAAVAGLVVMRCLAETIDVEEPRESEPRRIVTLADFARPNLPLARLIAQEWHCLQRELRGNISDYFDDDGSYAFWDAIADVAADYPIARIDVSKIADQRAPAQFSPNLLRFVSITRPKSAWLRDLCLSLVWTPSPDYFHEMTRAAAATLVEHFPGDLPTLSRMLYGRTVTIHDDGVVAALCAGWPQRTELDRLYNELHEFDRPGVSPNAYYNIIFSRVPHAAIAERLRTEIMRVHEFAIGDLRLAVVNRLRWDEDARGALASILSLDADVHLRATIPGLLRMASAMGEGITQWCSDEVDRQHGLHYPELGFDLVAGEVRPVGLAMLDALA